jgi:membrane-bound lytic murein transglycosylase B
VIAVQTRLSERGFDVGEQDGVLGPATRKAIQAFQHSAGLVPDGQIDAEVMSKLGVE